MGWDRGDFYEAELERQKHRPPVHKQNIPKPAPLLDAEWDEDAGRYVETIGPGPLTKHFSQGDPGDEN